MGIAFVVLFGIVLVVVGYVGLRKFIDWLSWWWLRKQVEIAFEELEWILEEERSRRSFIKLKNSELRKMRKKSLRDKQD